jgi:MFS family permease
LTWALIDPHDIAARLAGSLAMLIAFIVIERRQRDPMLDLALFRRPDFLGAVAAMAGYSASAQVLVYFFPLYLQNSLGYSALISGVAMLPYAIPLCLMPRFSARAATRYGSRAVLAWGLAIVAVGDVLMALAAPTLRYPLFAAAMVVSGIGAGLLNGETAQTLQATIPTAQGGMAGGLSATVRFASILLAVAVLGVFYSQKGTPWVMAAAALVAGVSVALVWRLLPVGGRATSLEPLAVD